jgi:LacI family transcriptional regulator, galactose operon repressor
MIAAGMAQRRQRILTAARELQYRPNAIARGLRLATTGRLALLVPSSLNPVGRSTGAPPR